MEITRELVNPHQKLWNVFFYVSNPSQLMIFQVFIPSSFTSLLKFCHSCRHSWCFSRKKNIKFQFPLLVFIFIFIKIGISYLRMGNCLTGRKIFTFFIFLQHNWRKRLFSTKISQLQFYFLRILILFCHYQSLLSSIIIVLMSLVIIERMLSYFCMGKVKKPKFWLELACVP